MPYMNQNLQPKTAPSMDLPESIQQILDMPSPQGGGLDQQSTPAGVNPTGFAPRPSFAAGGLIGPQGQPVGQPGMPQPGMEPLGAPPSAPAETLDPATMDAQINDMLAQNPEVVARMRAAIESGIQSGELTQEELSKATQLAQTAMQNPSLYPQLREYAVSSGLAGPDDLPAEYDQGLVIAILVAAKSMEADVQFKGQQAGGLQSAQMQPPIASMEAGGALPQESTNADGSVPINAHEGEYVIPADVVRRKGTDFFDKMIEPEGEKSGSSGSSKPKGSSGVKTAAE